MPFEIKSYAKLGFQGNTGTGKTMTSALLLLALSVERHNKAPVLAFDTEPGWQFVRELYEIEGVRLIIRTGRHFKGLTDALAEAKREKCCGFAVDSLTHPWTELLQRFAGSDGRVPMHKFNQIKPLWNAYVVEFMDSEMHCIACGRLQWEMVTMEQEGGGYEVVRGDSKMKAGGGESFGYEPHVLVEMQHEQKRGGSPRGQRKAGQGTGRLSGLEYVGFVLKDRTRAINGSELRFTDFREYKPRGYAQVYNAFLPHLNAIEKIAGVKIGTAVSAGLAPEGNSDWYHQQQKVKIELEEIEGLMTALWPGQDAKSKKIKGTVIYVLFNTRSWSKVEGTPLADLQIAHQTLARYEKEITSGSLKEMPRDDETQVSMAIAEIHNHVSAEAKQSSLPGDPPSPVGQAGQEGGLSGTEPPSEDDPFAGEPPPKQEPTQQSLAEELGI